MFKNPDMFMDWLTSQLNFHQYSAHNRALIYFQNPEARYVASYLKWKELGFQVVKSGGIKVLCPVFLTVFTDKNDKTKSIKNATEDEKEAIKNGVLHTKKILRDYTEKTVFDIACTNATEEDLVALQQKKNEYLYSFSAKEISKKLCEYLERPQNDPNPYKNIYNIVKDEVSKLAEEEGMFDENQKRIIEEGVTFVVLNQMQIDTTLFTFETLKNIDYENDIDTLMSISKEICNASDYMVNELSKAFL